MVYHLNQKLSNESIQYFKNTIEKLKTKSMPLQNPVQNPDVVARR